MKSYLVLILSLYFTFTALGQQNPPDSGFTNKGEATNQVVNGQKEGKWIEYVDENGNFTRKENATSYELAVYKAGKLFGIVRCYYNNGMLESQATYLNGKMNGIHKLYLSGKIAHEIPYKDGEIDGVAKYYYDSGKISAETPYSNGKINGTEKVYSESGTLVREIVYKHGNVKGKKYYDKNGNQI
jgi:antitoxin component YwqK of YwqJK toxin-antitoxin module